MTCSQRFLMLTVGSLPRLELIDLPLDHVLCESGFTVSSVCFPIDPIVFPPVGLGKLRFGSDRRRRQRRHCEHLSLRERQLLPNRAVEQSAGKGSDSAKKFLGRVLASGPVMHMLLWYTRALIMQVSQRAIATATIR
jgi:hypothetical protein